MRILEWIATIFIIVGYFLLVKGTAQLGLIISLAGSMLFIIWAFRSKAHGVVFLNGVLGAVQLWGIL